MVDAPVFESPVVRSYETASDGALVLADASATVKWLVRGSEAGAVSGLLGVSFGSSRATEDGALLLGSRPGEWIILGVARAVAEVVDGIDGLDVPTRNRAAKLAQVAEVVDGIDGLDSSEFVTTLDWTHGRALFRVTGSDAPRMLEKVCSLDWSDPMTPDGAVVSASVAKVTCDIARNDFDAEPSYLIFCDRSFGQYLFDALIDAGNEFGLVVGRFLT